MRAKIISPFLKTTGTGKSLTAAHMLHYFAAAGKKVLGIDGDANLTLSSWFGFDRLDLESSDPSRLTWYDVLVDGRDAREAMVQVRQNNPNLYIIPAAMALSNADAETATKASREFFAIEALEESGLVNEFDYIIFDSPGNFGIVASSALTAANYTLMPVNAVGKGMEAIDSTLDAISQIKRKRVNPNLKNLGLFITRYRSTTNIDSAVMKFLNEQYGQQPGMFKAALPDSTIFEQAYIGRSSIFETHSKHKVTAAMTHFMHELEEKLES